MIPDFCASSKISRPSGSDFNTGGAPKSKSSPCRSGQLSFFSATQPLFHTSLAVNCRDHNFFPEFMPKAITASEESVGGSEELFPVATYMMCRFRSAGGDDH